MLHGTWFDIIALVSLVAWHELVLLLSLVLVGILETIKKLEEGKNVAKRAKATKLFVL